MNWGKKSEPEAQPKASVKDAHETSVLGTMETGQSFGGMAGLGSHEEQLRLEAEKNRPLTRWERKKKRILGESTVLKRNFGMGFLMGGSVGALMGGLTGTYFAYQYRQFSLIPMMMLTSGCSFGFFMGIGAIMRSGEM